MFDTERGFSKYLVSDANGSEGTTSSLSWDAMAANNNGFTLPNDTNGSINGTASTSQDFVSWTWRKAEKFFDVVTYTGNATNRTISHDLGSVPGMIIVKKQAVAEHGLYITEVQMAVQILNNIIFILLLMLNLLFQLFGMITHLLVLLFRLVLMMIQIKITKIM